MEARTPAEKAARFRKYVEETGMQYDEFKSPAPESMRVFATSTTNVRPSFKSPRTGCILKNLEAL